MVIRAFVVHRAEQPGSPGRYGRRDTDKLSRNVAGKWVSEPSCNLTLCHSGRSGSLMLPSSREYRDGLPSCFTLKGFMLLPEERGEFKALVLALFNAFLVS